MGINFIEEQVIINSDVVLKGTIAIPNIEDKKLPAVLIINGSGSADRDGNMKKPEMRSNIYKELAHFVTSLGFISLRYDKRSIGESSGDPYSTGVMDLVNDVNKNIELLQNHDRVDKDKIILIGHSEGCILATIANTINPVGGLILLAGAGTNIWEPMKYQNSQILEEVKKAKGLRGFVLRLAVNENKLKSQQKELFDTMINSTGDIVKLKGKNMPAKWFREHFKYSSEEALNSLNNSKCPILAVTGDKDVQANPEDLKRVEKLEKANVECVVIENMDHMLKEFKGEKTVLGIMKQYKGESSKPMHPQLKSVLQKWLLESI